jgi:glycosyltransferase domain-containing protein
MSKIPIIIISLNRHTYLDRCLLFYRKEDYAENLIIVDGSNEFWPRYVDLEGQYIHLPGLSFQARLAEGLNQSKSDLVVLASDDDFIIPSCIQECEIYMIKHQEYSCVYGKSIKFINNPTFPLKERGSGVDEIKSDSLYSRIKDGFLPKYIPHIYAVHKKDNFHNLLSINNKCFTDEEYFFCFEELLTVSALINGKSKQIRDLFIVRESKNKKTHSFDYDLINNTWGKFVTACIEMVDQDNCERLNDLFIEISNNQKKFYEFSLKKRSPVNEENNILFAILRNFISNRILLSQKIHKKFPSLSKNDSKILTDICKSIR